MTLAAAVALSGCAAPRKLYLDDSAARAREVHTRQVMVQTIPRGAYVTRNAEYVGVAPIAVTVRTSEYGVPLHSNTIRATDTPTGAWTETTLSTLEEVPERILADIRPYMAPAPPAFE